MVKLKVLLFLSSVRPERLADRISKLVVQQLSNDEFELCIIDPNIESLEIVKVPHHYYPSPMDAPKKLQELNDKISDADAFVIISAEYNWTIPPALSNIIDYFSPSIFKFKPLGIVTYSAGLGGMMACSHLITMMTSMGCFIQPMCINIPIAEESVTIDGNTENNEIIDSFKILRKQLQFSGLAFKNQKAIEVVPNINLFF